MNIEMQENDYKIVFRVKAVDDETIEKLRKQHVVLFPKEHIAVLVKEGLVYIVTVRYNEIVFEKDMRPCTEVCNPMDLRDAAILKYLLDAAVHDILKTNIRS